MTQSEWELMYAMPRLKLWQKLRYFQDSTGRVGAGACYRLEEGKRLVLDCDGLSKRSDRFPFAWMKNNRRFLPSSSGEVRLEQTRLIIEKARREDAGVYMCSDMMSTGYGQSTTGRVLHVATPIDLVPLSPRLVVRDGSTMRLRCNASAVPRPEVSWWKDGEPLLGGGPCAAHARPAAGQPALCAARDQLHGTRRRGGVLLQGVAPGLRAEHHHLHQGVRQE
ncbi:hypothetical protein MTO96_027232 [Rhipicephalus appendiculatus]